MNNHTNAISQTDRDTSHLLRRRGINLTRIAGLLLVSACFFRPMQATACDAAPKAASAQTKLHVGATTAPANESPIDVDYYQSSDNPLRAD